MPELSTVQLLRAAWPAQKAAAVAAFDLFTSWCADDMPRRVPGMMTQQRLAVRLNNGKTVEQAAAAEYVYRWNLAIKAPDQCGATGRKSYDPRDRNPRACVSVFGAPHLIGL